MRSVNPGETFVIYAILAWLSISVGPWHLGPLLFIVGSSINIFVSSLRSWRREVREANMSPPR